MKVRCTSCKRYLEKEEMHFRTRTGNACSPECLRAMQRRYAGAKQRPRTRNDNKVPPGIREWVLNRDGRRCRVCEAYSLLHIHHIDYRSQGGSHEAHNLITLCNDCHALMHSSKRKYQPLLRGMMWRHLVMGTFTTLPQFERWLDALRERQEVS